jgi:hypothetical protein
MRPGTWEKIKRAFFQLLITKNRFLRFTGRVGSSILIFLVTSAILLGWAVLIDAMQLKGGAFWPVWLGGIFAVLTIFYVAIGRR